MEKNAELHADDRYKQDLLEECRTMDDLTLFRTHNSKGKEIDGLDLDSEADYESWYEENSSFHCFDVVYARIHLGFVGEGEWRNQHAPFHLAMWFGVSGYWDDCFQLFIVCDALAADASGGLLPGRSASLSCGVFRLVNELPFRVATILYTKRPS